MQSQPAASSPPQYTPIAETNQPRLCRLTRAHKNDFYGFELKTMRADGKHLIGNVQIDSLAYRGGIREDDILLEVNHERVEGLDREHVVSKIVKHSKYVDLLVLSPGRLNQTDEDSESVSSEQYAAAAAPNPKSNAPMDSKLRTQSMRDETKSNEFSLPPPSSRLVQLTRANGQSYGFSISKSHSGPPYISEIDADTPAAIANLHEGDLILKLNGIELTDKSHSKILEIAKKQTDKGNTIELEIVDHSSSAQRDRTYSEATTQEDVEGNFQRL